MQKRNFGLDVIRASAITFVLINHILNYFITFSGSTIFGDISGLIGVEIFFVLSGFLIGRILFTSFDHGMSIHTVRRFYIRRWFRTLPLYYFLLVLFIILTAIATKQFQPYLLHFVFLQNFLPLKFFSISWSLAIEEWFYLIIPLLLFLSYKLKFLTKKTIYVLLILIICVISMRMIYIIHYHPTFDEVRKHIFLRFDSLMIGVLLAGMKLHWQGVYKQFQKPLIPLIALFLLGLLAYGYAVTYMQTAVFDRLLTKTLAFPVISVLIALMIPFIENSPFINIKTYSASFFRQIVIWVSILSYSLYLVHVNIFELVKGIFPIQTPSLILLPLALLLTFLSSYLLYRYIEKPFLRMRDRRVKK